MLGTIADALSAADISVETVKGENDSLWTGLEPSFMAYHWHGDVFDLPFGAVSLALSDLTAHQAFRYGYSAYGILFHMEVTENIIEDMVKTFGDELQTTALDGQEIIRHSREHLPPASRHRPIRLRTVGGVG